MSYRRYKRDDEHTYVLGAFPAIEAVESRPDLVIEVILSTKLKDSIQLEEKLDKLGIVYKVDDRTLNRISNRRDNFVLAVMKKEEMKLEAGKHLVLHHPSNMGNIGTIIRTMLGLGYRDLAIVGDSADFQDPRVIRASMGAFYKLRIEAFEDIGAYKEAFPNNRLYSFMLAEEAIYLDELEGNGSGEEFSLVFGNEGEGLPEYFINLGQPVKIPQSKEVDSLNLTIAAGLAMYQFADLGALK